MTYEVVIEEVISQTFRIYASSAEEAVERAKNMYYNLDLVLDQASVVQKNITCVYDDGCTDWEEF